MKQRERVSSKYLDSVDDLYKRLAEPVIGGRVLCELGAEEVVTCIRTVAASTPGQARKLQSFLHQVFSFAGEFDDNCRRIAWKINEKPNYDRRERAFLPNIELSDYEALFQRLYSEKENRQVALFLLFAFFVGRRPKECLRAQWSQIKDNWYYPRVTGSRMDWAYRRRISGDLEIVLAGIRECNHDLGLTDSPMIFPSSKAIKSGHLTSFSTFWNQVRNEVDFPDEELFDFIEDFGMKKFWRRRTRLVAELFENMAEMSKSRHIS